MVTNSTLNTTSTTFNSHDNSNEIIDLESKGETIEEVYSIPIIDVIHTTDDFIQNRLLYITKTKNMFYTDINVDDKPH